MTEQEFIEKAKKLAKQIVDAIADKEYTKIAAFAQIDPSWAEGGQGQEEAWGTFGEWLDEQLAIWEEDEGRSFIIDHFNESCLEDITVEDNESFVTYTPTNSGERLDLWFELIFAAQNNERLCVTFNVNI